MRVVFLGFAHLPYEERIRCMQKPALEEVGCEVFIISACMDGYNGDKVCSFDSAGMTKPQAIYRVCEYLRGISPDIIICDNPVAILAAQKYKKSLSGRRDLKLYYDVTDFYPGKTNLYGLGFLKNTIKRVILSALNFYSGFLVDGFIFGEYYKSKFFKRYFGKKKSVCTPYYPDLKFFKPESEKKTDFSVWNMLYCGRFTEDKGFFAVLDVMSLCAIGSPDKVFNLNIITGYAESGSPDFSSLPGNLRINILEYLPFEDFCHKLSDNDMFFDLRVNDRHNTRCLPIKIFYYMAVGKPVVYSNLRAIRNGIPEIDEVGILVGDDVLETAKAVSELLADESRYCNMCNRAVELSRDKYNWQEIKSDFVRFVIE